MTSPERHTELDKLFREHGGLAGLAREIGQADPAVRQGSVPQVPQREPLRRLLLGALLRQDAANVLFIALAAALLAWFVWTLL